MIAETARRFRTARLAFGHGTLNANDEAAWLVMHALGRPFEELSQHLSQPLPAAARRRAAQRLDRRIAERSPAAYRTHEAWLGDLRFSGDPRVIGPRSY
ncbi:MAG: 50S ribosomal protein L3 N(5)-glutamine methyltransferase, partial [Betaproteobacteria bacterium]